MFCTETKEIVVG